MSVWVSILVITFLAETSRATILFDANGFTDYAAGSFVGGQDSWESSGGMLIKDGNWVDANTPLPSGPAGNTLTNGTTSLNPSSQYAYRGISGAADHDVVQAEYTLYYNGRAMATDNYQRGFSVGFNEITPDSGESFSLLYRGNPYSSAGNNFEVVVPRTFTGGGSDQSITGLTISRYNKTDVKLTADYTARRWWADITVTDWNWDGSQFTNETITTWHGGGTTGYYMADISGGTGALTGVYIYSTLPGAIKTNRISLDNLVVQTSPEPMTILIFLMGASILLRRKTSM
jgi:hypothetical protein